MEKTLTNGQFNDCIVVRVICRKFLTILKLGASQFLIIRPVLLVISMMLWVEDRYEYIDETTGRMEVNLRL